MHRNSLLLLLTGLLLVTADALGQSTADNPSINPPSPRFVIGDNELSTGLTVLTEMSPLAAGQRSAPGGQIMIRHAFSDRVMVGIRGWSTFPPYGSENRFRGGIGLEALLNNLHIETQRGVGVVARGSALFLENSVSGGAMSLTIVAWMQPIGDVAPYVTLGPIVEFYNHAFYNAPTFFVSLTNTSIYPAWIYGITSSAGARIDVRENLSLRLELGMEIQGNTLEHTTYGIFTPSIGIAWQQ